MTDTISRVIITYCDDNQEYEIVLANEVAENFKTEDAQDWAEEDAAERDAEGEIEVLDIEIEYSEFDEEAYWAEVNWELESGR